MFRSRTEREVVPSFFVDALGQPEDAPGLFIIEDTSSGLGTPLEVCFCGVVASAFRLTNALRFEQWMGVVLNVGFAIDFGTVRRVGAAAPGFDPDLLLALFLFEFCFAAT